MPANAEEGADALVELAGLVDRLGVVCPWTAEKSGDDMIHYLRKEIIEVEEVTRAARTAPLDREALAGEIGDVLFDALMLARVSARDHGITLQECCASACDKLRRRSPYLFDGTDLTKEQAEALWQEAKQKEKRPRGGTAASVSPDAHVTAPGREQSDGTAAKGPDGPPAHGLKRGLLLGRSSSSEKEGVRPDTRAETPAAAASAAPIVDPVADALANRRRGDKKRPCRDDVVATSDDDEARLVAICVEAVHDLPDRCHYIWETQDAGHVETHIDSCFLLLHIPNWIPCTIARAYIEGAIPIAAIPDNCLDTFQVSRDLKHYITKKDP